MNNTEIIFRGMSRRGMNTWVKIAKSRSIPKICCFDKCVSDSKFILLSVSTDELGENSYNFNMKRGRVYTLCSYHGESKFKGKGSFKIDMNEFFSVDLEYMLTMIILEE